MKQKLNQIFRKLDAAFGAQHWWPAESSFEVMVGAILTQNTNWSNVEKAIGVLKEKKLLNPKKLYQLKTKKLGLLIKSAGYYNLKAARLKNFLKFFFEQYAAQIKLMAAVEVLSLRKQLLEINGIGPETADSILLYAIKKPVFVVDAYTKRIFLRHGLIKEEADYNSIQNFIMTNLKKNIKLFGEFHALLVKLGKEYCRKQNPKCKICPLNGK